MSQIELVEVIVRKHIFDSRGSFLKIMNGNESGLPDSFGEIYMVVGRPGESRANHYHRIANEWFTLISGEVILTLVDVAAGTKRVLHLDSTKPVTVKVPAMVAHSFVNDGTGDFSLLAYSDYRYDAADTIAMQFSS